MAAVQVVLVRFDGQPQMKLTLSAESPEEALRLVQQRFPTADMDRTEVISTTSSAEPVRAEDVLDPESDVEDFVKAEGPEIGGSLTSHKTSRELDALLVDLKNARTYAEGSCFLQPRIVETAARLHHAGLLSWSDLASKIGCNPDHLRRKARAVYPVQPSYWEKRGKATRQTRTRTPRKLPVLKVSAMSKDVAPAPTAAFVPGEGWKWFVSAGTPELRAAGCTWAVRFDQD